VIDTEKITILEFDTFGSGQKIDGKKSFGDVISGYKGVLEIHFSFSLFWLEILIVQKWPY
jgi:hypothetical protein